MREYRLRSACWLLTAVITVQYLAVGANTGMFAMAGGTIAFAASMIVLWLLTPDIHFWRAASLGLGSVIILFFLAVLPAILANGGETHIVVPDLIAFGLTRMAAGAALLLAGSWVGYKRGGLRQLAGGVAAAGVIDISAGLILRQIDPLHVWGLSKGINAYRFTGTLLNANASGCIFGVTTILISGLLRDALLHPLDRGIRALRPIYYTLFIAVAFGACAITGSRTASALTLIALVAVFIGRRPGPIVFRSRTMLVSGCGIALVIVTLLSIGGATTDRIKLLGNDIMQRLSIWAAFVDAASHAPWFGYGAASFSTIKDAAMNNPDQARLLWYVNSPHNIIISLVLERGLLFLAGTLLVAVAIMPSFIRVWRERGHRPIGFAALAACVMIFGCALVDIALDVPAIMGLTTLLLGAIWGRGLRVYMARP